jgi:hypothetical protein
MTRRDELLALARERWPEMPDDVQVIQVGEEATIAGIWRAESVKMAENGPTRRALPDIEEIHLYQFRGDDGSFNYAGYGPASGVLVIHIGREHCCPELAWDLGTGGPFPTLAYISPTNWARSGHLAWWYPGADGPGYYIIYELLDEEWEQIATPAGVELAPKIQYRRLQSCPYCGAELQPEVERN